MGVCGPLGQKVSELETGHLQFSIGRKRFKCGVYSAKSSVRHSILSLILAVRYRTIEVHVPICSTYAMNR